MGPEDWCREYEASRYLREAHDSVLERRFKISRPIFGRPTALGTWSPPATRIGDVPSFA